MNKGTHGGKRPGSGRKPANTKEPSVKVSVRLLRSQWEWLSRDGNASETLRKLIQETMQNERQDLHN